MVWLTRWDLLVLEGGSLTRTVRLTTYDLLVLEGGSLTKKAWLTRCDLLVLEGGSLTRKVWFITSDVLVLGVTYQKGLVHYICSCVCVGGGSLTWNGLAHCIWCSSIGSHLPEGSGSLHMRFKYWGESITRKVGLITCDGLVLGVTYQKSLVHYIMF